MAYAGPSVAAAAAVLWEAESEEPQPANMGSAMAATSAVETIIFFITLVYMT